MRTNLDFRLQSRGGDGGGDSFQGEPHFDEPDQFSRAGGPPPDDDIPF
jgi:hypothetical protein